MNTKSELPLVTVGMPVYNEEKYIEDALKSIINQDYDNLEILISDNHSTDKTGVICRGYAEKDQRIHYHCHDKNIGVAANHIYLTQKARGEYFMWAAGHDKRSINLVSQCIFQLENIETAPVAFGTPVWIGKDGKPSGTFAGWYDTRGLNPVARFFMVFWGSMNPILGIFRRKDLPDLKSYDYAGADLVLLAELALKGGFIHAANTSFYRRETRTVKNYDEKIKRYKSEETQIANTFFSKLFPLAKLPFELLRIVLQAKIGILEKSCIIALLIPSFPIRYILGKKDHIVK